MCKHVTVNYTSLFPNPSPSVLAFQSDWCAVGPPLWGFFVYLSGADSRLIIYLSDLALEILQFLDMMALEGK